MAIAALRAGRPVQIKGGTSITVLAVETATPTMLELLDPDSSAELLISGQRAAALLLANLKDAAEPDAPVLLARTEWLDADTALALADPGGDMERGPIGPLQPIASGDPETLLAALSLARSAGLLPALWLVDAADVAATVSAEALALESAEPAVTVVPSPVSMSSP